jgi:hypothetical protein
MFIYSIGIKDIITAWALFYIQANTKIIIAYTLASFYCLMVWVSYNYFYEIAFLDMYHLRGTFVTLMMLLQVYGLTQNGGIKRSNTKISNKPSYVINTGFFGAIWSGSHASNDITRANKRTKRLGKG